MMAVDTPFLVQLFRLISERLEENREYLCLLDGEIGDGDHGTSMANGFAAVARRCRNAEANGSAPPAVLQEAASTFLGEVGATVGPLYATALQETAQVFKEKGGISFSEIDILLQAFADGIARRGKARQGDKTMLDAWLPAARAAHEARRHGDGPHQIIARAAEAASSGAQETASMIASRGRAARLKERTIGKLDPGAASASLIIAVISEAVGAKCGMQRPE